MFSRKFNSQKTNHEASSWTVKAQNISKCYRIYDNPRDRLLEQLIPSKHPRHQEFWALKDISFELKPGSTMGVIGRNGSGKSTLLQIICGTLEPTSGHASISGRIGALLELGSGFNPEFTGLENIFLNATILGLKQQEIEQQLDAIIAFADIGDFLGRPVKQYSSGMVVRLAFAVQAHIKPSILVVDEALAVGDELFQKKCFSHLEKLKQAGTSILLVSHSCSQINQHCDTALLLHKGRQQLIGDPHRITSIYQQLINANDATWDKVIGRERANQSQANFHESNDASAASTGHGLVASKLDFNDARPPIQQSWDAPELRSSSAIDYPHRGAKIISIHVENQQHQQANHFTFGTPFNVVVNCEATEDLEGVKHGCFVANHTGTRVTGQAFPQGPVRFGPLRQGTRWRLMFQFNGGLWPGLYFVGAGITDGQGSGMFLHRRIDHVAIRIVEDGLTTPIGNTSLAGAAPTVKLMDSDLPERAGT